MERGITIPVFYLKIHPLLHGNVLSKKWKLCFLKGGYKYTPFWETWSFLWWRYKNEGFQKSINRAWPYRSFEWFVKTFFST